MPKSATPKWALVRTWRTYSLHVTKKDAEAALEAWKQDYESVGWVISGSMSRGSYVAAPPEGSDDPAKHAAGIKKLADHPVCYIGVTSADVETLRRMESEENPAFERYSADAKALSEEWRQV
jgi:hypothetical protein